jgi:hypothetical protein
VIVDKVAGQPTRPLKNILPEFEERARSKVAKVKNIRAVLCFSKEYVCLVRLLLLVDMVLLKPLMNVS